MRALRHALVLVTAISLVFMWRPAVTMATTSVPGIITFWDWGNDGFPNSSDSIEAYKRIGIGWTTNAINSATMAAQAWQTNTDWNPSVITGASNQTIRVDGAVPGDGNCGTVWPADIVAGTCKVVTLRDNGYGAGILYYDMSDSDIGLNMAYSFEWNPNTAPGTGKYSARGEFTHEMGHGVYLIDLNCTPGDTMCGASSTGSGPWSSWQYISLTADDIWSANYVYLP